MGEEWVESEKKYTPPAKTYSTFQTHILNKYPWAGLVTAWSFVFTLFVFVCLGYIWICLDMLGYSFGYLFLYILVYCVGGDVCLCFFIYGKLGMIKLPYNP